MGRSDRYGFAGLIGLQFALLWPFRHYVTDDSYIHLQFARNLAAGQGFSFQPGEPIYGFTSPLWVLLLAAGERLGCDGLFLSRVLGLLFTVASVLAVYGLARVWIPERRYVWMATLAWAVDAWLLRWTFSGMDTSLGVFLVAMGFFLHARGRRDRTSPAPAMTFFSLAALSRPECLALCALAWLDASFGDGLPSVARRSGGLRGPSTSFRLRRLLEASAAPVLLLLPWLVYAEITFGRILPSSAAAKSPAFAGAVVTVLHTLFRELTLLGAVRGVELVLLAVVSSVLLLRLWRGGLGRDDLWAGFHRYGLPVAWLLVFLLGYALRETVLVSRYVLLVEPSTAVLGWAGLAFLLRGAPAPGNGIAANSAAGPAERPRLSPVAVGCCVAAVALNLGVLYGKALPHAREFPAALHGSLGEIADWLRENTDEKATVGSPDIGLLGYRSGRRIIDLSGLVTPDLLPVIHRRRVEDFISEMGFAPRHHPDYLIDRAIETERLPLRGPHGERLEVVLVREIGALGVNRRGPYFYTLYRVDWSEAPGLAPE